jgi:hypothetical protein
MKHRVNETKAEDAALYSLVRPFLPIAMFFVGLALLIDGLIPTVLPFCVVGYLADGAPVVGRCVTPLNVSLVAAGIVIVTASSVWIRRVYLQRSSAKRSASGRWKIRRLAPESGTRPPFPGLSPGG